MFELFYIDYCRFRNPKCFVPMDIKLDLSDGMVSFISLPVDCFFVFFPTRVGFPMEHIIIISVAPYPPLYLVYFSFVEHQTLYTCTEGHETQNNGSLLQVHSRQSAREQHSCECAIRIVLFFSPSSDFTSELYRVYVTILGGNLGSSRR